MADFRVMRGVVTFVGALVAFFGAGDIARFRLARQVHAGTFLTGGLFIAGARLDAVRVQDIAAGGIELAVVARIIVFTSLLIVIINFFFQTSARVITLGCRIQIAFMVGEGSGA